MYQIPATQQTSAAKFPSIFQKLKKKVRALRVNEKKIICTFRNMILVKTVLRKVIPRNDDLPKVIVTKIKFNKSTEE